jgi:FkbM family methyltransferase
MKNIVNDFGWYFLENDKAVKENIAFAQKYKKEHPMEVRSTKQIFIALSHCKNFRRAIDVGAHYGTSSYHFSNNFKSVEAFEVDPYIRECLEKNVNNFNKKNVTVYPYGCGKENKYINLLRNEDSHFTKINSKCNNLSEENSDSKIVRLDDYDWQDVDFIKIDVEGYENEVILGALKLIERCKPIILYEKDRNNTSPNPQTILNDMGYKFAIRFDKDDIIYPSK